MDLRRPDLAWLAGLLLASAALPWVARGALGLVGPAGTDPALWTLSALDLERGLSSGVSPLYPALVALVHRGAGHAVGAAVAVTSAAAALVGPLAYLLGRALGARPVAAGLAAAVALLSPAGVGFSVRVGPDVLVAGVFAAAALAAVALAGRPESWPRLAAVVAVAALAPLVREHGLVLAACLAALVVLLPGAASARGLRLGAVVVAVLFAPLVVGILPAAPWELAWNGRLFHPVADMAGAVPKYAAVLQPELHARLSYFYAAGDRLGIVGFHARWALRQDPGTWAVVLLALASLARLDRPRWSAAVALVPVLPALVIWSAPRHVGVALPVALAVLAAAWGAPRRAWVRWAAAGVAMALLAGVSWRWSVQRDALAAESKGIDTLRRAGLALCEAAAPGDVAVGEAEAFLYCPLPRHRPQHDGSAADWRTWWVVLAPERVVDTTGMEGDALYALRPPELPWARVWLRVPDRFQVYRLAPWVGRRPCRDSAPVEVVPFFPSHERPVAMEPACAVDPWSFGAPPARVLEEAESSRTRPLPDGGRAPEPR